MKHFHLIQIGNFTVRINQLSEFKGFGVVIGKNRWKERKTIWEFSGIKIYLLTISLNIGIYLNN